MSGNVFKDALDSLRWTYRKHRDKPRERQIAKAEPPALNPEFRFQGREVTVSLTSYGTRVNTASIAIKSLMMQTVAPTRIVLYLDDSLVRADLPADLLELESKGLVISAGHEDFLSHKKYRFAMEDYPDSLLILADDDLVYEPDTVESLLKAHAEYPSAVIGRRAHRVKFDSSGQLLPYTEWDLQWSELCPTPRMSPMVTTGSGSLYPPELFPALLDDFPLSQTLAPTADDIWLKVQEVRHGIPSVVLSGVRAMPAEILGTNRVSLYHVNGPRGNDEAMGRLLDHYHLDSTCFDDATVDADPHEGSKEPPRGTEL